MPFSTMFSFSLFAAMFFLLFFGAAWSWALRRRPATARAIGAGSAMLGATTGAVLAAGHLAGWTEHVRFAFLGLEWRLDALSAFFLLPIAVVGLAAACHSLGYLKGHDEHRQGVYWFFFNTTVLAMALVTAAATYVELLLTWELMGVMSFALVAFDYQEGRVRHAAWVYLLACHAGAVFLILMFVLQADGLPAQACAALACGLLGFGLKAGFPLLHVWLPEAHPAAPAPVSAIMSAAMVNLGVYGILRFLPAVAPAAIGWLLLGVGLTGALGGILLALAQDNLKRLLAYSTIENMGIVFLGLGLGFLGLAQDNTAMAICGLGGGILHLWNHALLKSTLFLLAGTVYKATGTLALDKMGGLGKRMPATKTAFAGHAAALSGLPPGNAFLSEVMIYLAAFQGILGDSNLILAAAVLAAIALALTGGLAAAAFAKATAAVFLGEPRSSATGNAREAPWVMRAPAVFLTILAVGIFLTAPWLWEHVLPGVLQQAELTGTALVPSLTATGRQTLAAVRNFSLVALVVAAALAGLRHWRLRRQPLETRCTWDCGYALPTARMQYTGTAFTQPLTDFFNLTKGHNRATLPVEGYFPETAGVAIDVPDPADRFVWHPLSAITGRIADRTRRIQSGYLHLYILMVVVALATMLVYAAVTTIPATQPADTSSTEDAAAAVHPGQPTASPFSRD